MVDADRAAEIVQWTAAEIQARADAGEVCIATANAYLAGRGIPYDNRDHLPMPDRRACKAIGQAAASKFGEVARGEHISGWPFLGRGEEARFNVRHAQGSSVGFLVRSPFGDVRSIHERVTQPRDGRGGKYAHLGGEGAHWTRGALDEMHGGLPLIVIEGVAAAMEVRRRTGIPAVGAASVAINAETIDEIVTTTTRGGEVWMAPDFADLDSGDSKKDQVRQQVVSRWAGLLATRLEARGVAVRYLAWDSRLGKGLDDVLGPDGLDYHGDGLPPQIELLEWDDYRDRWGWNGPRGPQRLPECRQVEHSIDDARREIGNKLDDWLGSVRDGAESLMLIAPPGTGKTTDAARRLVRAVADDVVPAAVLELPTVELAAEKMQVIEAEAEGTSVRALRLIGARPDTSQGWHCERWPIRERNAKILDSPCKGCDLIDTCRAEPGRYLHDREEFRAAVGEAEGRCVIVATQAAAAIERASPSGRIPPGAVRVIDDAGLGMALSGEVVVPAKQVRDALAKLDDLDRAVATARSAWDAGDTELPMVLVDHLAVRPVLEWLAGAESRTVEGLRAVVDAIPEDIRDELLVSAAWSDPDDAFDGPDPGEHDSESGDYSEGGEDEDPKLRSRWALRRWGRRLAYRILGPALRGALPVAASAGEADDEIHIDIPRAEIVADARAGLVCWLGVERTPRECTDALRTKVVEIQADAPRQSVVRLTGAGWALGLPGTDHRARRAASVDSTVGAIERAAAAGRLLIYGVDYSGPVATIATKEDIDRLGRSPLRGWWGAHDRATDAFAGVPALFVTPHALPAEAALRVARSVAAATGLPVPEDADDPLVAAVQAHALADRLRNAVGRQRPHTADRPQVAFLAGTARSLVGVRIDATLSLRELGAMIGEDIQLPVDGRAAWNEEQRHDADARWEALAERVAIVEADSGRPLTAEEWVQAAARQGIRLSARDARRCRTATAQNADTPSLKDSLGMGCHDSGPALPDAAWIAERVVGEHWRGPLKRLLEDIRRVLDIVATGDDRAAARLKSAGRQRLADVLSLVAEFNAAQTVEEGRSAVEVFEAATPVPKPTGDAIRVSGPSFTSFEEWVAYAEAAGVDWGPEGRPQPPPLPDFTLPVFDADGRRCSSIRFRVRSSA